MPPSPRIYLKPLWRNPVRSNVLAAVVRIHAGTRAGASGKVNDRATIFGAVRVGEGLNMPMVSIGRDTDPCVGPLWLTRVDCAATRVVDRGTPVALRVEAFDRSTGTGRVRTGAIANIHRDSVVPLGGGLERSD